MSEQITMDRRGLLRRAAAVSAGLVAGPVALTWLRPGGAAWAATDDTLAFVDDYQTNLITNLSADTNAAVRILSGMARLWRTGTAWNTGATLRPDVLRASMRYAARVTRTRTDAQAKQAFIYDRQHQSYAVIDGLGPLAGLYKAGALAVTTITSAPDGTPADLVNDGVPAGAPAGSAIGAGSPTSALGSVVQLVNTVRGNFASGNPSKYTYQYPRPWRMTEDSQVVDTGAVDAYGFPIYRSDVVVAPQLLRQRSTSPPDDAGFPSGHTNAFHLAALALAYAVPERFQELVTRAYELADLRIVAGMHTPVDVVGGRILATALAAATLADPANAALKAAARAQAAGYLQAQTGTTADTLFAYAHAAGVDTDPYADPEANERAVAPLFAYVLRPTDEPAAMVVPKGAEVLLETRLPYLDAPARREVLRTTALAAGYPLLDGPEQWGRLNLFAAADGYGRFDRDVRVTMDAARGGFSAADAWRNDIDGAGGLVKLGSGTLSLAGRNRYRGGTTVCAGTLAAGSPDALGTGDVLVSGGTLRVDPAAHGLRVHGGYTQLTGTLAVTARHGAGPEVSVDHAVSLGAGSVLAISVDRSCARDATVQVIRARGVHGRFAGVTVTTPGYRAVPAYSPAGISVRLIAA